MASSEVLERIAMLLPEERRERYYQILTRLKDMPEDDEYVMILEAMGCLTMIWKEIPEAIETILIKAMPVGENGTRETNALLIAELKACLRETLNQPTYEDLRTLLLETREGQQAFRRALRRLEAYENRKVPHRLNMKKGTIVLFVVVNMGILGAIFAWFWQERRQHLQDVRSEIAAAESLVKTLWQAPRAEVSVYDGRDESLGENVRAVMIDGPIIDTFRDDEGRVVVRLESRRW